MRIRCFIFMLLVNLQYANSARSCYYACTCDDCDTTLTTQQCLNDNDYCYSMKEESGEFTKGCISKELAGNICEGLNETQCWSCVGDFCNSSGSRVRSSVFLLVVLYSVLRYGFWF